jgi:hypothetical protein
MNISGFALTAVMFFEGSLSADEKMMITGIAALVVLIALLLLSTLTGAKHDAASKGAVSRGRR